MSLKKDCIDEEELSVEKRLSSIETNIEWLKQSSTASLGLMTALLLTVVGIFLKGG